MRAQAQAYAVQIMADTLKVQGPAAEAAKLLIAREVKKETKRSEINLHFTLHHFTLHHFTSHYFTSLLFLIFL